MNAKGNLNYLTEGIVIAGFTLISYVIAFEYESGFCSYWKIPKYFINISLVTAITSGLSFCIFIFWTLFIMNLPIIILTKELSRESSFNKRIIICNLGALFILNAAFRGYGVSLNFILILSAIILLEILLFFVPWIQDKMKYNDQKTYTERISRHYADSKEILGGFDWIYSFVGIKIFLIIMCLFFVIVLLSTAAGSDEARKAQIYLVDEQESLILIKRYGETYILRPIDLSNNKVKNHILIWRSEDIAKHKFSPKFIKKIEIEKIDNDI